MTESEAKNYINLKKPDVANLVITEQIKSQEFAFMTHQDICPEKWKHLIDDVASAVPGRT